MAWLKGVVPLQLEVAVAHEHYAAPGAEVA